MKVAGSGGGGLLLVGRLSWDVFIFEGIEVRLSREEDRCVDEPLECDCFADEPLDGLSLADFLDCLVDFSSLESFVVDEVGGGCDP